MNLYQEHQNIDISLTLGQVKKNTFLVPAARFIF